MNLATFEEMKVESFLSQIAFRTEDQATTNISSKRNKQKSKFDRLKRNMSRSVSCEARYIFLEIFLTQFFQNHEADDDSMVWDSFSDSESDDEPAESEENGGARVIRLTSLAIQTKKKSTMNYFDENGYGYSIDTRKRSVIYLKCKNAKTEGCSARVIIRSENLTNAELRNEHSHPATDSLEEQTAFKQIINKYALEDPFCRPQDIYRKAKEDMREEIDVDTLPTFNDAIRAQIKRMKNIAIPKQPKSLEEFESSINSSRFSKIFSLDKKGNSFYRNILTDSLGKRSILFISNDISNVSYLGKN